MLRESSDGQVLKRTLRSVRHWLITLGIMGLAGLGFSGFGSGARGEEKTTVAGATQARHQRLVWKVVRQLRRTEEGQRLLQEVTGVLAEQGLEEQGLDGLIVPDRVSKTDALLVRRLNPMSGQEEKIRKLRIHLATLDPEVRFADLVVDFAHELVHAIHRPSWDPYDPSLSVLAYVQQGIDGPGGEVEAVYGECKVRQALLADGLTEMGETATHCESYAKEINKGDVNGAIAKISRDFYKVGSYYSLLRAELPDLPLRSSAPVMISSTGDAPYPYALWKEFTELNQAACANSAQRLATLQQAAGQRRMVEPTQGSDSGSTADTGNSSDRIQRLLEKTQRLIRTRCR